MHIHGLGSSQESEPIRWRGPYSYVAIRPGRGPLLAFRNSFFSHTRLDLHVNTLYLQQNIDLTAAVVLNLRFVFIAWL